MKIPSPEKTILSSAMKLIETDWCQGWDRHDGVYNLHDGYITPNTGKCAVHAFVAALETFKTAHPRIRVNSAALSKAIKTGFGTDHFLKIGEWNDKKGRTKEEVLSAMQRAIDSLPN